MTAMEFEAPILKDRVSYINTLEQIRRYIRNTKGGKIPDRFAPSLCHMVALAKMAKQADIIDAVILAFDYGFSKGVRVVRQEEKEARAHTKAGK